MDIPPVDMETGEILEAPPVHFDDLPPLPEEEWIEPEIILPQADYDLPSEVDFPEEDEFLEDEDVGGGGRFFC